MFHRHLIAAAAGALAIAALPQAASAANATSTVTAKIVKPLTLTGGNTIALGTIIVPSTPTFSGTFTIAPAATQTGTYCATNFVCSGTVTSAKFNIQGQNNTPLNLTIPLTVTLTQTDYTGTGTTPTITVNTTNSLYTNNATGVYSMTLANSGAPGTDFWVGGSLVVNQATPGGTFSGTLSLIADYQ